MATQQQRRQLSIQEERVGKAASELEKARVESNKMQDALEGKQKVLQEKEDQLKKVQEEAARKEQEATEASQLLARKVDELQQLDDEKRRAEELLREMTIKRDTAAQARETAAKELEAMEKQQQVKTQAREAKEAEVKTQGKLIEQLEGQLMELREKVLDFEGKARKLNEERGRIDVRLKGIQQARVQLNSEKASVKGALKAQQEKQSELEAEKQRCEYDVQAKKHRLNEAQERLSALKGVMQEVKQLIETIVEKQQKLDAEILRLQQLQQLQQALERKGLARAIDCPIAKSIAAAEGKRNELRISAADRARQKEKVEAEIKEVLADKRKLEDEVVDRQAEIGVACKKLSSLDAQLTQSKDQLRVLEGSMAEADATEVALKDQQITLSSWLDECATDLSKCRAEETRATANMDRATQKEDELKKELRSLTGEIKLGAEDVAKKRGVLERADSAAHQLAEQVSSQDQAREDLVTRQKAANAEKLTLDEQSKCYAAKAQQLRGQADSLKNEAAEAKRAWEAADEAYKGQKSNVLKMENKMRTLTEERDRLSHIVNAVAADVAPASLIADHQVDEYVEHKHIRQPQFN